MRLYSAFDELKCNFLLDYRLCTMFKLISENPKWAKSRFVAIFCLFADTEKYIYECLVSMQLLLCVKRSRLVICCYVFVCVLAA